jgi:hypothetical protein
MDQQEYCLVPRWTQFRTYLNMTKKNEKDSGSKVMSTTWYFKNL